MKKLLLLSFLMFLSLSAFAQNYVRLKGYYRVYQLTNSRLAYFWDGMMEMYVPIDSTGKDFCERKFLGERRRRASWANGDDTFLQMALPMIETQPLIATIDGEEFSRRRSGDVYRWAERCGNISKEYVSLSADSTARVLKIEMDELTGRENHELDMSQLKMYGIIARMTRYDDAEVYTEKPSDDYHSSDIISAVKRQTFFARYRGEDNDDRIDVTSEFYVTDRQPIDEHQLKRIRKAKNHIWQFTIPQFIPSLDSDIAKAWTDMVEY